MRNYKVICLFLVIAILILAAGNAFAQLEATELALVSFKKDMAYDIYYEVSRFEVDCVENVKIRGMIKVFNKNFLLVTALLETESRFPEYKEREGYILFDNIKAILPNGVIKPQRAFHGK